MVRRCCKAAIQHTISAITRLLIGARLLQVVAGGMLVPQVSGLIQELFAGAERGPAFGFLGATVGLATAAGAQVVAFQGTERLAAVVLADGERVACDVAVVGVGIDPEVPAVAGSAMAQDNGILVDELCRTSAADVYAAGDVANHLHPVLGRIRVEHYNSADHHGAAAARSMLGSAAPSTTSTTSGPTSTSTRCSTSATPPAGTTSPFGGACRKESSLASTCSRGWCRLPSASTAEVILNGIAPRSFTPTVTPPTTTAGCSRRSPPPPRRSRT